MTIYELYEWAVENDVLDMDIEVYDSTGEVTSTITPEIVVHRTYEAVQL